jgi:hypothetical protein
MVSAFNDRTTVDWLRKQAYTVLAELMTSDNDRVALQAAQVTLSVLREHEQRNQTQPEKVNNSEERGVVLNYTDYQRGRTDGASGSTRHSTEPQPLSGSGVRATVGQDRSGEDSST